MNNNTILSFVNDGATALSYNEQNESARQLKVLSSDVQEVRLYKLSKPNKYYIVFCDSSQIITVPPQLLHDDIVVGAIPVSIDNQLLAVEEFEVNKDYLAPPGLIEAVLTQEVIYQIQDDDEKKWQEIDNILESHQYGEDIVITEPGVCPQTFGGQVYQVCALCGKKYYRVTPSIHNWVPITTEDGVEIGRRCSTCGLEEYY